MTGRRVLVTGGAGFIGSHLVDRLLATGNHVTVLDDLSTGRQGNLAESGVTPGLIVGSVVKPSVVARAVAGAEVVFHLAALPSVQRSLEAPLDSHAACATGTLTVLNAARKARVRRVVYAASSSAYGDTPGAVRVETDPVAPLSPYAAAKLAGEHYCQAFTRSYGLETVRLRFFNIFGPRQRADSPYSGVIALFIRAMSEGRRPAVQGDGLQSRDFTFVESAVDALVQAADAPAAVGRVYNVGTGGSTTVLDLVAQLNRILGTDLPPQFGPARAGDVRHSCADVSAARRDLGYELYASFADGLEATVAAYQEAE